MDHFTFACIAQLLYLYVVSGSLSKVLALPALKKIRKVIFLPVSYIELACMQTTNTVIITLLISLAPNGL